MATQLIKESKKDDEEQEKDAISAQEEGWALPKKKVYTRFSQKQITYITKLFEQGEETGIKHNGRNVEKKMPKARDKRGQLLFKPSECLSYTQIQGFFNRLLKKKKDTRNEASNSIQRNNEAIEVDGEEEEELDKIVDNDALEALDDITIDELLENDAEIFNRNE